MKDFRREVFPDYAGRDAYAKYLENFRREVFPKIQAGTPMRSVLGVLRHDEPKEVILDSRTSRASVVEDLVRVCPTCGWWIAFRETVQQDAQNITVNAHGGVGGLIQFDVGAVDAPLRDLRCYLVAKYEARFNVNPRVFEDAVASVFRDLGYRSRVTAYSGDDGVDVILDGPSDTIVGVQVKRYRDVIAVEELRALVGALVIGGMTSGVFVTTSTFTSGAARTIDMAAAHGVKVELYDAPRFYDALKIAQRAAYQSGDELGAPFSQYLPLLRSTVVEAGIERYDPTA